MGVRNLRAIEEYTRYVGWSHAHDGLNDVYRLVLRHIAYRASDAGHPVTLSRPEICIELMGISRYTLQRALRRLAELGIVDYEATRGSKFFVVRFRRSIFEHGDPIEQLNERHPKRSAEIIRHPATEASKW